MKSYKEPSIMTTTITQPQTMQATWYDQKGSTQVLQTAMLPIPEVGAGEVLIRVHASGVNPSDTKARSGWDGMTMPFSRIIPHNDGAGVIEQVGGGVSPERIGDRVWIYEAQLVRPLGTAAEYVVVPSQQAVPLPENTTFAEGACLGVPAMTAHRAVFASGSVEGQTVLVTGGAGAVGYYALQLAKWGGATVITTVSRSGQANLAKDAGADFVINYKTENVVTRIQEITGGERGIDRVVDVDFEANLPISQAVLKGNGAIATYSSSGGDPGAAPNIPFFSLLMNNITIQIVLVYTMPEAAKQAAIRDINTVLSGGALKHNIAQRFSLQEVAAAHDAQDSGQMVGKAIVEVI
jgi:NADPH:quinone reductase